MDRLTVPSLRQQPLSSLGRDPDAYSGSMSRSLGCCCVCRWVQGECRGLGDMDAPEVDPLLQRAAQVLREREVLFRYCAEEVTQARHNALFQR